MRQPRGLAPLLPHENCELNSVITAPLTRANVNMKHEALIVKPSRSFITAFISQLNYFMIVLINVICVSL